MVFDWERYDGWECPACAAKRHAKQREEDFQYQCHSRGIGTRHRKFRSWDALTGPPEYLKARDAVRKFCETGTSVLGLIGTRGAGKTQFGAVAIMQVPRNESPFSCVAKIRSAVELAADLKADLETQGENGWFREHAMLKLLVVDEIQNSGSEYVRTMLETLIDARYREERPTILIGNLSAGQFSAAVGPSTSDRCNEGGGLVVCDWPSFRGQGAA